MELPGLTLGGLTPWTLLKASVREFFRDDAPTYAAALSFHLFFALFPFLIFVLSAFQVLGLSGAFRWIVRRAEAAAPEQVAGLLHQVVPQLARAADAAGLLSFAAAISVWMASVGMRSLMNALNQAYDVQEGRPIWKRYLLSILYTVAFSALVLASTLLVVLGPALLSGMAGAPGGLAAAWRWLRYALAIVLAAFAAALVYRYAPCGRRRFRMLTPGSLLAVALWGLISSGFRFYVSHFGNYRSVYGRLGAVVVLLLYIFLSAAALLFGGEVNGVVGKHAQRTAR